MSWDEAREHMRTIRRGARADESFWYQFGAGYHPFHLLMLSTNFCALICLNRTATIESDP